MRTSALDFKAEGASEEPVVSAHHQSTSNKRSWDDSDQSSPVSDFECEELGSLYS
jgi:hypothetical protein